MQDVIETFNSDPTSLTGERSGSGMFSDVDLSPCGKYAIKHGNHGFADGWLLYAAALLAMPKDERPEWAPRIHSLRVDLYSGTFVALMDALYEYEGDYCDGGNVYDLYCALQEYDEDDTESDEAYFRCTAEGYPEHGWCVEFLYEIEMQTGIPLYYDIGGNVMWDGESVIMNDPVCVKRWQDAKKDLRYRDQVKAFVRKCELNSPDIFIKGEHQCAVKLNSPS